MVIICNKTYTSLELEGYFEKYPYSLSDFQKYAIEAIVKGDHVLITAHTGSGKTLPAEFAIQYFVEKGKKVIYTSPIKALSNQKYYEFSLKYPGISFGLFTGDIKTNPEADVLIMTTEILMNALISRNGSTVGTNPNHFSMDLETELAAVVFDEVHYINDADRGQNWEKTLLLLPAHIQKIMLSATIDSPERFAKWVENLSMDVPSLPPFRIEDAQPVNILSLISAHPVGVLNEKRCETCKKKVYLCSTNHRVVPLTHYGFFVVNESSLKNIKDKSIQQEMRKLTGEKITIQNDKGVFQETGYATLKRVTKYFEKETITRKYVLNQLALYLRDREMLPAIFFVFSRKNVEAFARDITVPVLEDDSKIPYTIKRECDAILRKLPNAEEYYRLPEYQFLVGLLEKGIGIHHSGMIPILREIVEFMISKKYIKILFATESFAIGLDCPIKTAVFTGMTKFDGSEHRWLMAHEYTQMAGRAGRRGIDTIGHVIHCNNLLELPTQTEYRDILCGKAQTLISKFRISYSWVLSFLLPGFDEEQEPVNLSKKSMIYEELQQNIQSQRKYVESLETDIMKKEESIQYNRCPIDVCKKYIELQDILSTLVNKKKKEKQREMEQIEMEYKTIKKEVEKMREIHILREHRRKETEHLEYIETYIELQTEKVKMVLFENGFITSTATELSILGKIASKMSEVHPLVWSKCISEKWDSFAGFSVKQIVGILSCITDIKIPESFRRYSIPIEGDVFLQDRLRELQEEYQRYEQIEKERGLRTGMHYTDAICFDIVEEAMKWCDCESEEECKVFISCELSKKEIGVGDFTKAMLKIATVAREWLAIPEIAANTPLEHKLMQIDTMVLKYIATNQSLYV